MKDFGKKVRALREQKGLTREEICRDEVELSVRQLARIEADICSPNIERAHYLAKRLNISLADLADEDVFILPRHYLILKDKLLRLPTYGNKERMAIRENYFETIYNHFYPELPEEEQLIIDCLQTKLDIHFSDNDGFALGIFQDYLKQVFKKTEYNINDLVLLDLYLACFSCRQKNQDFYDMEQYDKIMAKLFQARPELSEECYQLNNVLLNHVAIAIRQNRWTIVKKILDKSETLMAEISDFQKQPIWQLVTWKYQLYHLSDLTSAKESYEQAVQWATITKDLYLSEKLTQEWEKDYKTFVKQDE